MAADVASTTFERLRILCAVESAGTIAGAARAIDYTPSAVSQQFAVLEREAGVALAERSNRGIELTAAGRRLAAHASQILDGVRTAFDDLSTAGPGVALRVAAFPTAISALLLPLRDGLPADLRLTIVHAEPDEALRRLIAREVDGAVTDGLIEIGGHRADELHRTLLRVEPVVLVTSTQRSVGSLADCVDAPWVLGGSSSRLAQAARQLCQAAGFAPDVVTESEDHHVTFDVVRADDAVSVLPALAVADLPPGVAVARDVDLGLERRIEFVTRARLGANPSVAALASLLVESTRPNPHGPQPVAGV